ncbi:MAG: hypothetical protein KF758_09740 [Anaerolineales bacterium]|nr:hypothetical protein [Anaerolineales bacterium]
MKKYYSFLFLLSLLIISCAPTATTESIQTEESTQAPLATPTAQEAVASPQALTTSESTPLPEVSSAPLIDSPSIINIEMIDERNGWGVTEKEIVRTDDGGVTWYNVTPPSLKETGYSVFTSFLDENNAWIQIADNNNYPFVGFLYRTRDGGLTWQEFETPFSAGDIEFIDENNGWILADLGVGAGSMAVSVFQTNNGGETWERVYTNDPNLEGSGDTLPLGGIKVLLVPLDMQTAWIGGVVYANGTVYLFRTDDGGETWTNVENIELPQGSQNSQITVEKIHFVSATQGILVLRVTSTNQRTLIFSTNDGGVTWQAFSQNIPEAGLLEIPSANEIVFYSSDQFYITEDAGVTFNIINSETSFGNTVTDISFVNSKNGWLITTSTTNRRTLYRTEDGGQTWNVLIQ